VGFVARKRPFRSVSATPMAEFSKTDRHRSSLFRRASSVRLRSVAFSKEAWPCGFSLFGPAGGISFLPQLLDRLKADSFNQSGQQVKSPEQKSERRLQDSDSVTRVSSNCAT